MKSVHSDFHPFKFCCLLLCNTCFVVLTAYSQNIPRPVEIPNPAEPPKSREPVGDVGPKKTGAPDPAETVERFRKALADYQVALRNRDLMNLADFLLPAVRESLGEKSKIMDYLHQTVPHPQPGVQSLMAEVTEEPGPVTALPIRPVQTGAGEGSTAVTVAPKTALAVLIPTRIARQEGWSMTTLFGSMLGLSLDEGATWSFADITSERNRSFVRRHYPGALEELGTPVSFMEVLEQGQIRYLVQRSDGQWQQVPEHPRRWPLARIEQGGLFRVEEQKTAGTGPDPGRVVGASEPILVSETTKIPARAGVTFGYFIDISFGESGRKYEVRQVQRHPPMKLPDGRSVEKTEVAPVQWEAGGFQHVRFPNLFSFLSDYPYEIVPGTWTFETLIDGRKVAERAFVVE